jgi:hypothetical protein
MQDLDDFAKSGLDKLEKLADNFKWIQKRRGDLKQNYNSKYVAIKDRTILDNDTNFDRLIKRLNIRNYDESIAIEYIYN